MGLANPTAGVTVNGNTANRKGEYFHWPLSVPNGSAAYPNVSVVSQYGGTQTDSGKVFVPATTEAFQHDLDGNLTSDGRWTYTWDGENRLIEMKRDVDAPTGARQRLVFEYDHQGRRIRKQYFTYSSGWQEQTDIIFLYDGWNLMGELNANASNAKLRTYVWGLDLSATPQGAGGVGGLLMVVDYTSGTTYHNVAYDGNGNVSALANAANGAITARYEYGPFGEPTRTTGTLAEKNPFRFSTKYTDQESGIAYYGYRFYSPQTGRWLNPDPIQEQGGLALYVIVANSPIDGVDPLGLDPCKVLVVVFVQRDDDSYLTETVKETLSIVLNAVNKHVTWIVLRDDPPRGTRLGRQRGMTDSWKRVFYATLDLEKAKNLQYKPIGMGNIGSFAAVVWPNRFMHQFDLKDVGQRPPGWEHRSPAEAWNQMGGFVAAHEVLHSVGATHDGSDIRYLMSTQVTVDWLVSPPEISRTTKTQVASKLGVKLE